MEEHIAMSGDKEFKSFSKYLTNDLIIINPKISNKDELFEKMVNHLYNLDIIINRDDFYEALIKRENMASTELIPGVALPHACSDSVHRVFVSIVIMREGIDYGNIEMGPARIIFFFGSSDKQNKEYLKLLAKASRLLQINEFCERLIESETKDEVFRILREYDKSVDTESKDRNYLAVITLFNNDHISNVLTSIVELGITNGTIMEGTSIAKKIAYEMPIFAGLSYMRYGKSKESNIILCHIDDKMLVTRLIDILKQYNIDFSEPGTGNIQLIKVDEVIGAIDETIDL